MTNRRWLPGVALLLASFIVAACGTSDAPPATPGEQSTPEPTPRATGPLPDGESFVLVRGIEGDRLIVDPAEFLGGEEAAEAARADGFLPEGEDLPNDFYLRNLEEESLEVGLAPDARFILIGFDDGGGLVDAEVDAATFFGLLTGDDTTAYYGFIPTELPMHLVVEGGLVTAGMQQYVP
jgi:hypothetical protein